ncbi:hypothetical protein ACH5RR_034073 [Cinchona calisaya]|uniref:FAR1 domain-containing protein n=1 Tax=Cinchona calisaya TaxID=153742 RepID=A0ABD2YCU4_9GENT
MAIFLKGGLWSRSSSKRNLRCSSKGIKKVNVRLATLLINKMLGTAVVMRVKHGSVMVPEDEVLKEREKREAECIDNVASNKLETSTCCKAMVVFGVDEKGNWEVNRFVKEHNHEMAFEHEKHLFKSGKLISEEQGNTLLMLVNSRISITNAYSYLSKESGENEFEETWSTMIASYNLEGHSWLKRLYGLRDKWCTALTNGSFSAGFKSMSRSEGINHILNGIGSKTTSLMKFVLDFERKIDEWRQNEAEADFLCKNGRPPIQLVFTNRAMHFAYDIITRSTPHETKRHMVWNALDDMSALLDDVSKENKVRQKQVLVNNASNEDTNEKCEDDGTAAVLNPVKIRSKGAKRGRLKGHFEKRRKKSSSQGTELKENIVPHAQENLSFNAAMPQEMMFHYPNINFQDPRATMWNFTPNSWFTPVLNTQANFSQFQRERYGTIKQWRTFTSSYGELFHQAG